MKTTITIPVEIKRELELLKGNETWEGFFTTIIEILKEKRKERVKKIVKELYKLVDISKVKKMELKLHDISRY